MSTQVTLYHRTSSGKIKVWTIEISGNVVTRTWGMREGKMQNTVEKFAANSKMSATEVAQFNFDRAIRFKKEEGYTSNLASVRTSSVMDDDDMEKAFASGELPDAFAPAKPISSIPRDEAIERAANGEFCIQRKRDGRRAYAMWSNEGNLTLWSRKIEDITDRFPFLVRTLAVEFSEFYDTILDMEIVVDRDGSDDFRAVGTVATALPAKAAARERELPVKAYIFDVLYFKGVASYSLPYRQRYNKILSILPHDNGVILPPKTFASLEKAEAMVKENGWEGLVLWEWDSPTVIRMDGKETRTNCYKFKVVETRDFVAYDFEYGNGKNAGVMGSLMLRNKQGKFVGMCGGGFTDEQRKWFASKRAKFPMVVEVEFDKQEPDSLKLRFPVFVRIRDDKKVEEVD